MFDQAKITYNYCGICGHVPKDDGEPNRAPIKWWDPDDGWKIGSLCRYCYEEQEGVIPQKGDFAYNKINDFPDVNTDEDIHDCLL